MPASSSSLGENTFLTKCACQATSVMKRTERRVSGFARTQGVDNEQTFAGKAFWSPGLSDVARFPEREVCCRSYLCLCLPTRVSPVVSSRTIYLSFGERPVKIPVSTATAPQSVNTRAHNLSGSDRALPDTAGRSLGCKRYHVRH